MRGGLPLCVNGLPPHKLKRLQVVGIPLDCFARLSLEAWDIFQEFDELRILFLLDLFETLFEVAAAERGKVDRTVLTGLDSGVAQILSDQGVRPETVLLVFLVHLLEVYAIHPLVCSAINSELVGRHLLEMAIKASLACFLAAEF